MDYYVEGDREVPFDADKEEGTDTKLELLPGLSDGDIEQFAAALPAPLPSEIRELLTFTSGFNIDCDEVRFMAYNTWGYGFLLPHVIVLNGDGRGNSWVIEVNPDTGQWQHVWFECHDPTSISYQCTTLSEYVDGVLDQYRLQKCLSGHRSILSGIDGRAYSAWRNHRTLPRAESLREADDPVLREFAAGMNGRARVADHRCPKMGDGFDWSSLASGPRPVKRAGTELLFGIEPRRGLFGRLFG